MSMLSFRPRLLDELRSYDRAKLADNLAASLADGWRRARELARTAS